MELQQQADINLGGTKQAGVDHNAKPKARSVEDSQQSTPFEDHVKEQLDQAKSADKQDKGNDNQQLTSKESGDSMENPNADGGSQSTESGETGSIEAEAAETTAEQEINSFTNLINVSLATSENAEAVAPVTAAILPEVGKQLPPASVTAPQIINQQQAGLKGAAAVLPDAAAQASTQLNIQTSASTSNTSQQTIVDTVLPAGDLNTFKSISTSERPNFLNMQGVMAKGELSAAELVTNATRMQQVPLTTAMTTNLGAGQNVNAASATALTDTALPLTTNTALGSNGLSSVIGTHVQSPEWSRNMSDQVSMMIKGGFQKAEIKLNPAHLGPMEIKLSMTEDKASINFVTQHVPVRDAIDSALPRLRDMLEEQGLSLADVDVSTQSEQQSNEETGEDSGTSAQSEITDMEMEAAAQEVMTTVNAGIESGINLYA